ncbi:MAG: nucleotidyltransferase domain-containing protein [Bacteroidetes bacterium]|nr:MAG: nucleotidyltransferase domain-containing protein [Bacteroidota bacterium]
MTNYDKMLSKIKKSVTLNAPDAQIILYGSHARGDYHFESDWDIIILVNEKYISYDFEKKITHSLYDIEFESGEIISPMVYSEYDWNNKYKITPFYQNVMKDGIKL